jgi:hypothetical protein
MAEDVRRGIGGRGRDWASSCTGGVEVGLAVVISCDSERPGLRDRARLSSVDERDLDGTDSSSVGKLVVPECLATVVVIMLRSK